MNHSKHQYSTKELDKIISQRFTASFMNDSKWEKLIGRICDISEDWIHINYKLIHSDQIFSSSLNSSDFKPFFIEPVLYKEVEWVEFPDSYEDYVNQDNLKAGKQTYKQDIALIKNVIQKIGRFELEHLTNGLKLYAYK